MVVPLTLPTVDPAGLADMGGSSGLHRSLGLSSGARGADSMENPSQSKGASSPSEGRSAHAVNPPLLETKLVTILALFCPSPMRQNAFRQVQQHPRQDTWAIMHPPFSQKTRASLPQTYEQSRFLHCHNLEVSKSMTSALMR